MRLKTIITFLAIAAALSQAAMAQTPSEYNLPGKQYPMINPDRTVTFRIEAPKAKSVVINLGKPYPMSSSGDGQWTVTTEPVAPGFHYYSLTIDGVRGTDPATQAFFGSGTQMSGIEVPELCTGFYLEKDVPHGEVREQRYWSELTGSWRVCNVYVPAQYLQDAESRFPVLYLLHGAGEDETGWPLQGKVRNIMDNLIDEGSAVPMIVVMDHGVAEIEGIKLRDMFDWLGGFSGSGKSPGTTADLYDASLNDDFHLMFISTGTKENPMMYATVKNFHDILTGAGVKHIFYQSEGTDHEWLTWRRSLYRLVPLLFK